MRISSTNLRNSSYCVYSDEKLRSLCYRKYIRKRPNKMQSAREIDLLTRTNRYELL